MRMETFIGKYTVNGIQRAVSFNKAEFTKEQAEEWMKKEGIKNFWLFFDPIPPQEIDENTVGISGIVGFDITADIVMPYINEGKNLVIDSVGGDLFEGWKIHDRIKLSGKEPEIGVIGTAASSAFQILLATEKRWSSENSRGLIHNPWQRACGDDQQLMARAKELETEKTRLAKKYAEISGKPENEILALMKDERFMSPEEMLTMNFIKEIRKDANNSITNQKNDDMANEELKQKVNSLEGIINGIRNLFTGKVQNVMVTDANGVQIDFYELEEESQIEVGAKARVDGSDAEGEYVIGAGMHEGKTFVFAAGELTEIKEAVVEEDEEAEALKTENAALKTEVSNLKKRVNSLNNALTKGNADLKKVVTELSELKNMVTDGDPKPNTPPAGNGKGGFSYKK